MKKKKIVTRWITPNQNITLIDPPLTAGSVRPMEKKNPSSPRPNIARGWGTPRAARIPCRYQIQNPLLAPNPRFAFHSLMCLGAGLHRTRGRDEACGHKSWKSKWNAGRGHVCSEADIYFSSDAYFIHEVLRTPDFEKCLRIPHSASARGRKFALLPTMKKPLFFARKKNKKMG